MPVRLPRIKKKWSESTVVAVGVAAVLLLIAYAFPLTTSLGQGINERVAIGWQGVLDPTTGDEYYRMTFNDGSFLQYRIHGIARSQFVRKAADGSLLTKSNLISTIEFAFQQDPNGVKETLGTYHNVPSDFHPFNEEPVAYTKSLLSAMSRAGFNPATVGGPNIPPGSVSGSQLKNGELQIDTKKNGNTLAQCQPGERPAVLSG